ncbi:dihydrofolate reductase family protein [Cytophagaceae bacterium DM2B3-1]|uniref:Dihydrofolate reductase family protein n=1 Tax=Xanthocytophaga flava TaxID=3048013 RepID=A0ABT7CNN4_9BACT|nr:dihydrofolate reductase family protein [Xanthocytophaga flavus]MDJ1495295.1 dihydrofolate reductase family protein [Xanthocytophaga flavus]
MRKIILDLAVTLDGFIEGPNGEVDWCIMDDDMGFDKFVEEIDTILYGRISYELYGYYTPDASRSQTEIDFAKATQKMKKYVFSRSLSTIQGNVTLVSENIAEEIYKLKESPGKDIWLFGGASLITSFIQAGLIDEYRIGVHPVALGSGKPLFQQLQQRLDLRLIDTKVYRSGVTLLRYKPKQSE